MVNYRNLYNRSPNITDSVVTYHLISSTCFVCYFFFFFDCRVINFNNIHCLIVISALVFLGGDK